MSFEAAQLAFDDPFAVVREDRRQDYGEDRYPTRHGPGPPTGHLSRAVWRASAEHLGPIGRTTGTTTLP